MNKRGWITLVATVALIAVAAVVGPALAHGSDGSSGEGTDGGTGYWEGCAEGMGAGMQSGTQGGYHMGFGGSFGLEEAAAVLGLTADELGAQLADGATPLEIIEAAGVDIDLVVDAILTPHVEMLQDRVEDGHLTAEDADAMLAQMELHVQGFISGETEGYFEMPCEIDGAEYGDHMNMMGGGTFGGGMMGGGTFGGGMMGGGTFGGGMMGGGTFGGGMMGGGMARIW